MIQFLEKSLNLWSCFDIEYNSAESLTNKYKLFGTKSKRTINYLAPSEKYIMIEKFKDELRNLKDILNEIKKLDSLTEKETNGMKNETKRNLNIPDDEKSDILEKLYVNLTTLKLRCINLGKPNNFEKERKLRLSTKEKNK